jgi:hypothetical protein
MQKNPHWNRLGGNLPQVQFSFGTGQLADSHQTGRRKLDKTMDALDRSLQGITRRRFIVNGVCCSLYVAAAGSSAASAGPVSSETTGQSGTAQPPAPGWAKDLVIYEIAPKGFTSPSGAGTGNFNSLREKLPYLRELGITGIWLAGYSLCDAHHFYNIWTQYAVIEPGKFDPSLGTQSQFKELIDEAHRNGIRIFLDTITHGLMKGSPVIRDHPDWFRGSSWGMDDFDWAGGHPDLDDWWVKLYTDFVANYGIDGFRLDVDIYRPDLWARIRRNSAALGHPIVIFEEVNSATEGVTDFTQKGLLIPSAARPDPVKSETNDVDFGNDVPGVYSRKFGESGDYRVEVQYSDDGSTVSGSVREPGKLKVLLTGLTTDIVPRRFLERKPMPDGIADIELVVENVGNRPIENITVRDDLGQTWQLHPLGEIRQLGIVQGNATGSSTGTPVHLFLATLAAAYPSALLSCHDNGWEGFPANANPFTAQGSRARFGYSFLFTPTIPIFFSGEEFDATFQPLPGLSPYLYSGAEPGKGRWLYGAQLDWDESNREPHRSMLQDVKSMIALRGEERDVFAPSMDRVRPNLCAVPYKCDTAIPVPYMRWAQKKAIVVAANRNTEKDVKVVMNIPLKNAGMDGHATYTITSLWPQKHTTTATPSQLDGWSCVIQRDRTPGGGVAVWRIEPA